MESVSHNMRAKRNSLCKEKDIYGGKNDRDYERRQ